MNKPIPDDLVKILAKDEDKQRAIIEKSTKDASSTQARAIGATAALSATPAANPPTPTGTSRVIPSTSGTVSSTGSTSSKLAASPSVVSSKTPTSTASNKNARVNMVIQPIPPFKGKKSQHAAQLSNGTTQATTKPSGPSAGVQPTKSAEITKAEVAAKAELAANKLNVNASSFRPNPKAVAFTPVIYYPTIRVYLLTLLINGFQASPNTAVGASANSSPKTKPEGVCKHHMQCTQARDLTQTFSVVLDLTARTKPLLWKSRA